MTLMQWAFMFWHDLAAPVMVGVLTCLILGWWRSRK
ncbi:type I toxin-antitoxin system toxin Ldr family protein [Kluyvera genomosp. 1]|nr:type I toxin-antitoxin system toxin Ldr family protein [Kluyvera genomosp. 1]